MNLNWTNSKQKLNTVIYKHVPIITKTSDNSKPIWMNTYIKRMLRKKSRMYKKKVEVLICNQSGNEGKKV